MNEYRVELGRKNRAKGLAFERKVRLDLEKDGWKISKWQNNLEKGKCIQAKMGRFRTNQNGFPDFICYKHNGKDLYKIIFVEVKTTGYLKQEEKEKALWYLENKYCSEFFVASLLDKKINYKRIKNV
jgi:hypothetical protein